MKCQDGLRDDDNLKMCYLDIGNDIEALKREGFIREIKYVNPLPPPEGTMRQKDKDGRVLFGIDTQEEHEKVLKEPEDVLSTIRGIWNDEKLVIKHAYSPLIDEAYWRFRVGEVVAGEGFVEHELAAVVGQATHQEAEYQAGGGRGQAEQ